MCSIIVNVTVLSVSRSQESGVSTLVLTNQSTTISLNTSKSCVGIIVVYKNITALLLAQSLQLHIFVIVSSSSDQFVMSTRLAYRALLDEVSVKAMSSVCMKTGV